MPTARYAALRDFSHQQQVIDQGIVLYFPGPGSFTGEDVIELQGHGGPVVMDMLLDACIEAGARQAKPGEFSERAFLNDRIDLAQAEAISDLIESHSRQAAISASRSLQGEFSQKIEVLLTALIELRIYVEAALDFPEEEIDFLGDGVVAKKLSAIQQQLLSITSKAEQGQLLRDGIRVVIAGRPNAGKSSLLNILAGEEAAIVSEIAGTTRDMVRAEITLDGLPLHIIDTAGLHDSNDPVEKIGIARAKQAIEEADLVMLLSDDTKNVIPLEISKSTQTVIVKNKIDLSGANAGKHDDAIYVSAITGAGISELKEYLKEFAGYQNAGEGIFIARRRHLDALAKTHTAVSAAQEQLLTFNAGELSAEELRLAQESLSKITGRFTSDDLLGEIFSSFCIGK